MNVILFDGDSRQNLLPLTYTRPIGNLRVGILTINEKWEKAFDTSISYVTQDYLAIKFPMVKGLDNVLINGGLCPDGKVEYEIQQLQMGQSLNKNGVTLAVRLAPDELESYLKGKELSCFVGKEYEEEVLLIQNSWDLFAKNGHALELDYDVITKGRTSAKLSESNTLIGDRIFIEEGAVIEGAIINTNPGPVYIGKDAEVMEGALIRGGLALCAHATLKMGAKIYGPTTIGPHCKAGGEISNSILFAYSNKGHDGFIGNTVIGEWCNIGADTNTSNLKNNYAKVRVWDYTTTRFANTGLQFCGLIMGDHSKCGINTMFNTGTVVGVSANIFGAGFPRNFIPSFAWGGSGGMIEFRFNKAAEVAEAMMSRRGLSFNEIEESILQKVYDDSANFRQNLK